MGHQGINNRLTKMDYNGSQQNESADQPEPFMSARVGLPSVEEDDRETRVKKT